jgi:hypothetical protein
MPNRMAQLAVNLTGFAQTLGKRAAGLFDPFRRRAGAYGGLGRGNLGLGGAALLGRSDPFGFNGYLREIGTFNPVYVPPFLQVLMRRSVMPRLALILMGSALAERQYVVEGSDPAVEAFHQAWLDRLLPQILRAAPNAVWYGWQPYIIDWGVGEFGGIVPTRAREVDPFTTIAVETELEKDFCGLQVEGDEYDLSRSFKLTWEGHYGNHYGEGQAFTAYPFWWAHSVLLVWAMRYYERSVDPVRVAFARDVQIPTGEVDGNGAPIFVDLTDIVAEALQVAGNGDSVAIPMGNKEGEKLVELDQLDLPDRSDTFLKMLAYLEQKMFLSTLSFPGLGVSMGAGDFDAADARTAEKTQLRVLEYVTDLPLSEINDHLLPEVHRRAGLEGLHPCPRVKGKAFKRETQERLHDLLKNAMAQPMPEVGPTGRPTGRSFRPEDLIRWDKLGQTLDLPLHGIDEVARHLENLEPQAPGVGGRPAAPLGPPDSTSGNETRPEARAAGKER